ncbi:HAD family hydrolase [Nocardioides sp. SYSU D00038]|uniref:HAD family hydrolase n=1 Tax=Nocardioides sp. SYSU D00038 TaxID=2812554 RepID=UPI001967D2ED|nr:HAD family hydrolase [Nocardioides sp. SYSU D00038]
MDAVETVVLDLDGTLVDSVYVHVSAWQAAFRDVGLTVPAFRLHRVIGMGADRLVAHVAGEAAEHSLGDEVRRRHGEQLDQRFHEIVPTEGAVDLLETWHDRGATLVLASSAEAEVTDRLLDLLDGRRRLLERVVTGSDVDQSKPAADLVTAALEGIDDPDRAVLLGDTEWDMRAAARAGVRGIGVLCGGITEAELRSAGASTVYGTPADLARHLAAGGPG